MTDIESLLARAALQIDDPRRHIWYRTRNPKILLYGEVNPKSLTTAYQVGDENIYGYDGKNTWLEWMSSTVGISNDLGLNPLSSEYLYLLTEFKRNLLEHE